METELEMEIGNGIGCQNAPESYTASLVSRASPVRAHSRMPMDIASRQLRHAHTLAHIIISVQHSDALNSRTNPNKFE